jgi:hypothetical protein
MKQTKYKETNGTFYHAEITPVMVGILESIKVNNIRARFHWGDVKTGKDWGDIYDVAGTIGRSTGPVKIPLLIHNARSMGGGALLDNCIVKITTTRGLKTNTARVIYQHPNYHV